jgi:hypothetical protein
MRFAISAALCASEDQQGGSRTLAVEYGEDSGDVDDGQAGMGLFSTELAHPINCLARLTCLFVRGVELGLPDAVAIAPILHDLNSSSREIRW